MIQFIGLKHQYGPNVLFDNFSWHIKPDQKIGLVGPNGAGKTTLFRIASDLIQPDEGKVVRSKETEISLFHQIPGFDPEGTILETAIASHKHYRIYSDRKHSIDHRFETTDPDSPDFETLLSEQQDLEDYANAHGVHELELQAQKILSGLGFSNSDFSRKVKTFSPGYQHRLGLAIALLEPHTLLFLDEPTNHLDDASKLWLADYLQNSKTAFVLVTHDPEFLNSTTNTIAEISKSGIIEFRGTLEEFLEEKNELHEKLKLQFQKEEAYLQKRMDWINRFRAQATKAKQVQSKLKNLEKREKVDDPGEIFWNKKPDYSFTVESSGKISFRLEDASFSFGDKSIFQNIHLEVSSGEKIALVGPNGAGKSTLMKCIAGIHSLSRGQIYLGPKTKIGYFAQTHTENLEPGLNILEIVQKFYPDISEPAARTLLGHFSFSGDSVFKKIGSLSGGEQSRVRLALLVLNPTNTLLLDEPTNHLDMVTRNALKRSLEEYPGSILIISHDPDFLKGLCNNTLELNNGVLKDVHCSFEDFQKDHKEGVYSLTQEKARQDTKQEFQNRNQEKNKLRKKQKELEDLEAQIGELEDEIKGFEKKLELPEFFQSNTYSEELKKFHQNKEALETLTQNWEDLAKELS